MYRAKHYRFGKTNVSVDLSSTPGARISGGIFVDTWESVPPAYVFGVFASVLRHEVQFRVRAWRQLES